MLLTGFLGAGKTTLLNRLIAAREADAGRIAIVVNEFGAVGIDGDLLPPGMSRQVELSGGCICCVLNEDLDRTMLDLLDSEPDLELIVIETTGIAEPLPISWSLAREPLGERLRLAAVITVVDALGHDQNRELSSSVDLQVEDADILVVSKLDLASPEVGDRIAAVLRQRNSTAPILVGDAEQNARAMWRSLSDPRSPSPDAGPDRHLAHIVVGDHHHHRSEFQTVALEIVHTLDFEELATSLEALPANYVRIKGIARVVDESTGSDEPHYIAFHRVGGRVSAERLIAPAATRLVALGLGIDPAPLAACLEAAVVT